LALGKGKCQIAVFDWLEDCLIRKRRQRAKCLSEKPYLLDTVLKRIRRAEKEKIRHTKKYITDIESTRELADPCEPPLSSNFLDT
jgi:hypothetical protein